MYFAQLRNVRPTGQPHTRHNGGELPNINLNEVPPGKLYATVDETMDDLNITDEAADHLRRFEISIHAKDFAHLNTGMLKAMAFLTINGRGDDNFDNPSNLTPLTNIPTNGQDPDISILDILDRLPMSIIGAPGRGMICRTITLGRREAFEHFQDPAKVNKKWWTRNKTGTFAPNYGAALYVEHLCNTTIGPNRYPAIDFMVHTSFNQSINASTALCGYIHPTARTSNLYNVDPFNLAEYTASLVHSNVFPPDTPVAVSTTRIHTNNGNIPVLVIRCRGEDAAQLRAQLGAHQQGAIQIQPSLAQPGAVMNNMSFSGGYKLAHAHVTGYGAASSSKDPPPLHAGEELRRDNQWRRRSIFVARKRTNDDGLLTRDAVVAVLLATGAIALQNEIINFTLGSSNQYATFSVQTVAVAIQIIAALGHPTQTHFFGKYDEPAEGAAKPENAKTAAEREEEAQERDRAATFREARAKKQRTQRGIAADIAARKAAVAFASDTSAAAREVRDAIQSDAEQDLINSLRVAAAASVAAAPGRAASAGYTAEVNDEALHADDGAHANDFVGGQGL